MYTAALGGITYTGECGNGVILIHIPTSSLILIFCVLDPSLIADYDATITALFRMSLYVAWIFGRCNDKCATIAYAIFLSPESVALFFFAGTSFGRRHSGDTSDASADP